ncbi:MAG TPA: CRTAC1 family protein [Planctomycetaceae bacterium]|nr:CRTAC1 family protein [Planctomycetaceae bacterium]
MIALSRRALVLIVAAACALLAAVFAWHEFGDKPLNRPGQSDAGNESVLSGDPLFEEMTAGAGLEFVHEPGLITLYQLPQIMGSGCAFLDFDQDGDLDIFLVNQAGGAGFEGVSEPVNLKSSAPTSRLYEQQPDGLFLDVTKKSGLDFAGVGVGVAVGDINNDGFPDIYVSCYGPDRLFLNLRDGTFADVTESSGIDNLLWGTSCAFVDFDRDGWLDLFVANYVDYHPTRRCPDPAGELEFCPPGKFTGTPHKLYRNESGSLASVDAAAAGSSIKVRFRDMSLVSGIARRSGRGLGVMAADLDGDRWPDFFVANDEQPNFLWINQRDGTFSEEGVLRGAAYDLTGHAQANMGIAVGDVDGDGRFDLLVTHFDGEMNSLYLNKSPENFEESAGSTGLGAPSFPYTSWGTAFFDVDHDGDLDLAVVNGRVKRAESGKDAHRLPASSDALASGWQAYAQPNQFFINDGTGQFSEVHSKTESYLARHEVSRGLAVGDVDNDGDLDLLVTTVAGPARLFRNVAKKRGHWLVIRAIEPAFGGRDAYGAVVEVTAGQKIWLRLASPAFSYLSSNDPRVHFGLGDAEQVDKISVIWADGDQEIFPGGGVDRQLVIRRGEGHKP